jgi:hypothetical protein
MIIQYPMPAEQLMQINALSRRPFEIAKQLESIRGPLNRHSAPNIPERFHPGRYQV